MGRHRDGWNGRRRRERNWLEIGLLSGLAVLFAAMIGVPLATQPGTPASPPASSASISAPPVAQQHHPRQATPARPAQRAVPAPHPRQSTVEVITVHRGDCLWSIARHYLGSGQRWTAIYRASRLVVGGNPDLIFAGERLRIPAPRHEVQGT